MGTTSRSTKIRIRKIMYFGGGIIPVDELNQKSTIYLVRLPNPRYNQNKKVNLHKNNK